MTKKNNQKIGCNVDTCKYNDCHCNECTLNEINVSCDCDEATKKKDTICDSYDSKKDI